MSLSATMWTSVSGLLSHGKKMNTIGNNIANINTVGFKGQRMDFADFVYQNTHSLAGSTQNGFGTQVGAIMGNFGQGAFESSTETTDLAITGNGFFQVQKPGSDEAFYTRAGNFRFDQAGYLKDPNGLAVQGWRVDNTGGISQANGGMGGPADEALASPIVGSGVPTDIKLDTWHVYPKATTNMSFKVNLPQNGDDNAKSTENPFAALFEAWDGTQPPRPNTPPIPESSYAKPATMQIYDEAGVKHTVTVYFDKVSPNDYEGGDSSNEVWEYIVTMDPSEDKRQFADPVTGALKNVNTTKAGGLLMSGTMTYSSSGTLLNQSAYTWGGTQTPDRNPTSFTDIPDPAGGLAPKEVINLDPSNMNNWEPAAISSSGYPMLVPNFGGVLDGQTSGTANGAKYNTEMSFGVKASNLSMPWKTTGSLASLSVAPYAYNTAWTLNDPTKGPKHLLLNQAYNSSTADRWHPNTHQYDIDHSKATWTFGTPGRDGDTGTDLFNDLQASADPIMDNATPPAPVTAANYMLAAELYGVKDITLTAGSIRPASAGVTAIPDQDVNVNLLTGEINDINGNQIIAAPPLAADGGLLKNDPTHLKAISGAIKTKLESASATGLYLFQAATPSNANGLANFTDPAIIEANASTSMGENFASTPIQNGYGFGDLLGCSVDADGVVHGEYSNGESLALWQITMFDFTNKQGLRREGNNLFSETRDSGEPKSGAAGAAGLGIINSNSLEQSNVDMSTEFVYMITTQRGYQSNSKLITTTDQMLETVINMKR